ncbi:uncharacterized protein LOC135462949 [Liolophura sinensis]|uniref:uncharacterized protein LOC135462949 n=1 Tax=Liolophura sinensis TaxID=3198878 RepID=UPI0031586C8C
MARSALIYIVDIFMYRMGRRYHCSISLLLYFIQYQHVFHVTKGDLCSVDICKSQGNTPQCPEGHGVILLRDVLISSGSSPALGSCTKAGVFNLLAKVCNARTSCQEHLLRQIQRQCCQMTPEFKASEKMEVIYNCIQENRIYDVCSGHRLPVPDFHRHVLSPNFTDEPARRDIVKLPFCQWSIPIPSGNRLTLSVNDLYVGPGASCEGETSFRLQFMDTSGSYQHLPASVLCGTSGVPSGVEESYSHEPILLPEGSRRAVVWFTPVNPKERLWFSYQFTDAKKADIEYNIPSQLGCGSHRYVKPTTKATTMTTTTTTSEIPYQSTSRAYQTSRPTLTTNTAQYSTKVLTGGVVGLPAEVTTSVVPVYKSGTQSQAVSPKLCAEEVSDETHHLQRFILIGTLAGVGVVAIVFVITSLVLFTKLLSRSRPRGNGLVRFIKADRLDSKPVVMEVECVERSSPRFQRPSRANRRTNIVLTEPRDRALSVHSSESPIYAMPYKQPAIRYGSAKRIKNGQHRVMIVEDPPCVKTAEVTDPVSSKRGSFTVEEDMLSLISGCTVTSSGVSVSDGDTADLKELMNSLRRNSSTSHPAVITPKVPSVRVRAEMRRPRFPPDVATDPIVRLPSHTPDVSSHIAANLYVNSNNNSRAAQDGGYELCRPFPVSNDDYSNNALYDTSAAK